MHAAQFDPSKAVTFDLAHGVVRLDSSSRVLVPADALSALCGAAGAEPTSAFGRALGSALGHRIAGRLSQNDGEPAAAVRSAGIEAVVHQLAAELALAGLGTLGLERWGRAIVLVVDDCPLGAPGDRALQAVLEGALTAMTGREVGIVVLGRDHTRARLLVVSPNAASKVRGWLDEGLGWPDVLARLHGAGAGSGSPR